MFAKLRVDIEKTCLVVFDICLFFYLCLGLTLLLATIWTAIKV